MRTKETIKLSLSEKSFSKDKMKVLAIFSNLGSGNFFQVLNFRFSRLL